MPIKTIIIKKDIKTELTKDTETSILKILSPNDELVSITLKIIETFDGDKSFEIGTPANHSFFVASDDVDLGRLEPNEFKYYFKASSQTTLAIYASGSSTKGSVELTIIIN
jgi:hypothetical protein